PSKRQSVEGFIERASAYELDESRDVKDADSRIQDWIGVRIELASIEGFEQLRQMSTRTVETANSLHSCNAIATGCTGPLERPGEEEELQAVLPVGRQAFGIDVAEVRLYVFPAAAVEPPKHVLD